MEEVLPPEILYSEILARLDAGSLLRLSWTSSLWRRIVNATQFYAFAPRERDERLCTSALLVASLLLRSDAPRFVVFVSKHKLRKKWAAKAIDLVLSHHTYGFDAWGCHRERIVFEMDCLNDKALAKCFLDIHPDDWSTYLARYPVVKRAYKTRMRHLFPEHASAAEYLAHVERATHPDHGWRMLLDCHAVDYTFDLQHHERVAKIVRRLRPTKNTYKKIANASRSLWLSSPATSKCIFCEHPTWKLFAELEREALLAENPHRLITSPLREHFDNHCNSE